MKLPITTLAFVLTLVGNAQAHGTHLGELAGHAHWVGVGAIVVAGAIAAAIAVMGEKEEAEEPETEEEAETAC